MDTPVLSSAHECEATQQVAALEKENAALRKKVEALEARHVRKSERMRSPRKEAQNKGEAPATPSGNKNRDKDTRKDLPTETIRTYVPEEQCTCPKCGKHMERTSETQDTIVERVPERLVHRTVVNEVRECGCGNSVTSQRPVRAYEQSDFGPALVANVVTQKLADSLPFYRQSGALLREGLYLHRNTLMDMFHGAAHALRPIWLRMVECVSESALVQADETSIRVLSQEVCKTAFMWVFLNAQVIAYFFAPGRSGEIPRKVLGKANDVEGGQTLLADGYSGYNHVVNLDGWTRAGCLAHGRRKLHEAKESAPDAVEGLDFIRWMYLVEHEAEERGIKGTQEHLELRRTRSLPIFKAFQRWLVAHRPRHGPRTAMGKAIRYALKQRKMWMRIFRDAAVPLDNNASESALRVVALLRKNAMFVGNDASGENHAILLSLVASCKLHKVNPEQYLADVLLRVQTHPHALIDELLPHNWKTLFQPQKSA